MSATTTPSVEARFETSEITEFDRADRSAGRILAFLLIGLFALLVVGMSAVGYWTSHNEATDSNPYASQKVK